MYKKYIIIILIGIQLPLFGTGASTRPEETTPTSSMSAASAYNEFGISELGMAILSINRARTLELLKEGVNLLQPVFSAGFSLGVDPVKKIDEMFPRYDNNGIYNRGNESIKYSLLNLLNSDSISDSIFRNLTPLELIAIINLEPMDEFIRYYNIADIKSTIARLNTIKNTKKNKVDIFVLDQRLKKLTNYLNDLIQRKKAITESDVLKDQESGLADIIANYAQ